MGNCFPILPLWLASPYLQSNVSEGKNHAQAFSSSYCYKISTYVRTYVGAPPCFSTLPFERGFPPTLWHNTLTLERGFPLTTSVVVTSSNIVCSTFSSSTPDSISTRSVATMDSTLFCTEKIIAVLLITVGHRTLYKISCHSLTVRTNRLIVKMFKLYNGWTSCITSLEIVQGRSLSQEIAFMVRNHVMSTNLLMNVWPDII